MFNYSVMDAIVTYRLWELGTSILEKQPNVKKLYYENVMPVFAVYKEAEIEGFPIDIDYLNYIDDKYKKKLTLLESQIREELGNIRISSLDDLGKVLEGKKFRDYGRNEKGIYRTGEHQLKLWK